ncbi:MAG TPA: BamA/TamA family outer membrane protein, partial [Polyangia bacterium]|nr:BamA/TamA family outer membrane protein [Polyangia bacterium]
IALESTSWVPLSAKHYLDPFEVDVDKKRIEAYYAAHGYFFAKVTEADVEPAKNGKAVDIKLVVDEGPATKINDLTVDGIDPIGPKAHDIHRQLKLKFKKGDVFDHGKYLEQKGAVEDKLKTLGFAWADVKGEVDVDRDAKSADLIFKIDPGPKAKIGRVYVRGYEVIDPKLILEHAAIREGKQFDPQVLEDARGRIYNLGVFSSVKVEYEHDPSHPELADIVITVHEGKFHELRLGGGVNFESTRYDVHLAGDYIKHNFLGGLRTLKLRLEPGWVFLANTASIGAPTGGPSNGPSLKATSTFTQPDFIAPWYDLKWIVGYDVGIDYAYQYHGPRTTLGVSRPLWHNRINVGVSYNFNFLMFFNTVPAFQNDPHAAAQLYGYTNPYRVAWLQEDFLLDLRDKPLDPHKGAYLGTTFEEGGVYAGGSFSYEKILPEMRLYVPMGSRLTLATRGEFGQIFASSDPGSPVTRRFFMGGPDSHRGFNYDRLSVQVPIGYPGAPNLPIGGDQLLLLQAELRLNIVRLYGNWFGITAFLDAGDVAAPSSAQLETVLAPSATFPGGICGNGQKPVLSSNVQFSKLHTAVGGGLRYKTVIGTIRVDVGVRVNRTAPCEPDGTPNPDPNSPVAFHISIGESF